MDFSKAPKTKNFEDRTGMDPGRYDWNWLLGTDAMYNQNIDPREALKGLNTEDMQRVLFQKAMEEFGTMYPNKYEPYYRKGRGPLKDPNK